MKKEPFKPLAERRKEKGLTREDAAVQTRLSYSTITKIEVRRYKAIPKRDAILALMTLYGVTEDELLGWIDPERKMKATVTP